MQDRLYSPVFVTGVERSGSSIVARVLALCGAFTGKTTEMMENDQLRKLISDYYEFIGADVKGQFPLPNTKELFIPTNWKDKVVARLNLEVVKRKEGQLWMVKGSRLCQIWPVWHYAFPNAKWIIVRRKTGDIIDSCCILGGRSKVRTLEGLKAIKDVKAGDYVLTHLDRYRKVTNAFKRPYFGEIIKIKLKTQYPGTRENLILSVTPEHRILVQRNGDRLWMQAKDIDRNDSVCIEAHRCDCGAVIPLKQNACKPCRTKSGMVKWNKENYDERLKINRELGSREDHIFKRLSQEHRQKQMKGIIRNSLRNDHPFKLITYERRCAIIGKALTSARRNNYLEGKIKDFLCENGINYIPQWHFKTETIGGFADFYLPGINTIIECDGEQFHSSQEQKEKDKRRDIALNGMGIGVLRFTGNQIVMKFHEVASKIKELCCIGTVLITKIEKYITKPRKSYHIYHQVYNLEVEDDESYVVNGFVVHNCKTGYMVAYNDREGWLGWVHQHEKLFVEMIETGLNCKVIWPERMVYGDYQQIYEMLDWLGLEWNKEIVNLIHPLLWSSSYQKERSKV